MSLFPGSVPAPARQPPSWVPGNRSAGPQTPAGTRRIPGSQVGINPHLLAARRLARQIRNLPDHSPQETRTGLAICRQLKAYLKDSGPPAA